MEGILPLLYFVVFFVSFCSSKYDFIQISSLFTWTLIKQIIITYSNRYASSIIEKVNRFHAALTFWFLNFLLFSENLWWKRETFPWQYRFKFRSTSCLFVLIRFVQIICEIQAVYMHSDLFQKLTQCTSKIHAINRQFEDL